MAGCCVLALLAGIVVGTSGFNYAITRNIRDIFVGRCEDFQTHVNPTPFLPPNSRKNCPALWDVFHEAYANTYVCNVSEESYDKFFAAAEHYIDLNNRAIFWSGVEPIVHDYGGHRLHYETVTDSLAGYLGNKLLWCRREKTREETGEPEDCHADKCPDGKNSVISFWRAISKRFATAASGEVMVMLNGSKPTAFYEHSIFSLVEVPIWKSPRIHTVNLVVVHDINKPIGEKCGTGSLLKFQKLVEGKQMKFKCTDDDQSVLHLLCIDATHDKRCRLVHSGGSSHYLTDDVISVLCLLFTTLYASAASLRG